MEVATELWFRNCLNSLPPTDNISPCLFLSQNCPWLWLAVSEQVPLYYSILPLYKSHTQEKQASPTFRPLCLPAAQSKCMKRVRSCLVLWRARKQFKCGIHQERSIYTDWAVKRSQRGRVRAPNNDNTVAFPAVWNDRHIMIAFSRKCQWHNPNRLAALLLV